MDKKYKDAIGESLDVLYLRHAQSIKLHQEWYDAHLKKEAEQAIIAKQWVDDNVLDIVKAGVLSFPVPISFHNNMCLFPIVFTDDKICVSKVNMMNALKTIDCFGKVETSYDAIANQYSYYLYLKQSYLEPEENIINEQQDQAQ